VKFVKKRFAPNVGDVNVNLVNANKMNEDIKSNKKEGFCDECGHHLCDNCGKCCHCGKCKCESCHPKEEGGELEVEEEVVNYS